MFRNLVEAADVNATCNITSSILMDKVGIKTKLSVVQNACDLYSWGGGIRGMLGHREGELECSPRVIRDFIKEKYLFVVWPIP